MGNGGEADVKTGDVRFSSDNHGLPHVHRVGNIGTTPFHVVAIGVRDNKPSGETALEGDTGAMVPVMEKPHASVYRIRLLPGEKTGVHTHHLPYTKVYLTAGELSNGNGTIQQVEAGDFLWQPGGETHSMQTQVITKSLLLKCCGADATGRSQTVLPLESRVGEDQEVRVDQGFL